MDSETLQKEKVLATAKNLTVLRDKIKYNFIDTLFPDEGPYRRELYPRHVEFFNGGSKYGERLFSAANQIGKTLNLLLEGYWHATGKYPSWWEGKKFKRPTVGIFGAETWEQMRNGIQSKLLTGADRGILEKGAGVIPAHILKQCKLIPASNVPGVYSEIHIPHVTGGMSKILFKTYSSGQTKWESITAHWCLIDEEPPSTIYTEAAMRVLKNDGTIAIGFTPDSGLTETVLHFFKDGKFEAGAAENKLITMVGWNDVPHITKTAKENLLQTIPEYLVDAKTKGIPYLGEGRIFQFDISKFTFESFPIPDYFPRCFAIDPGIKESAVLWAAIDPDTDEVYIYNEFLGHHLSIYTISDSIREHGEWIPGVMDPFYGPQSSRESSVKVIDLYKKAGLDVDLCDRKGKNYKESGIEMIRTAFLTGKLHISKQCTNLLNQLTLYHRDKTGKTGNTPDDTVDTLRYLLLGGVDRAISYVEYMENAMEDQSHFGPTTDNRDSVTGY